MLSAKETVPASPKTAPRGVTAPLALLPTSVDYANPDTEILAAVRPGLLTTHGPLLMASSVYAKTGVLYDSYKRYFGPAGPPDILVAHASSRDLNPSISQAEIDLALERDPVANRAEYLSEWRSDVEGFIPRDIVEFCVRNYIELPPQPNTNYVCFIDQATGVPKRDSFVAVVAHLAGDRVTVDAVREVRPRHRHLRRSSGSRRISSPLSSIMERTASPWNCRGIIRRRRGRCRRMRREARASLIRR